LRVMLHTFKPDVYGEVFTACFTIEYLRFPALFLRTPALTILSEWH
jgi:hypothetical protein